MGFCTRCGFGFTSRVAFCPRCGAMAEPVEPPNEAVSSAPPAPQPVTYQEHPAQNLAATMARGVGTPIPAPPTMVEGSSSTMTTLGILRPLTGVALLAFSMAFDWSHDHGSSTYVPAVLAVLVAIMGGFAALATPLQASIPQLRMVCLAALVPAGLIIGYTLLRSTIPLTSGLDGRDSPGLGMVLAAVGVIVIALVLLPEADAWATPMRTACVGLLGASCAWGLLNSIQMLRDLPWGVGFSGYLTYLMATLVMMVAFFVGLPAWFGVQIARRRAADWAAGMVLAASVLLGVPLIATISYRPSFEGVESTPNFDVGMAFALFFIGMAVGSAQGVAHQMTPPLRGATGWLQTAAGLLICCAALLALIAINAAASLYVDVSFGAVTTAVVAAAACVGAIICRVLLGVNPAMGRLATVAWAVPVTLASLAVQATAAAGIARDFDPRFVLVSAPATLLPLVVGLIMIVPASVRAASTPMSGLSGGQPPATATSAEWQNPGQS